MRIFLAGASGAIGRPLVRLLREGGHDVTGTARTAQGQGELRKLGCTSVAVDVFDADSLVRAVVEASPDVVIHQLTAEPRDRRELAQPGVVERDAGDRRDRLAAPARHLAAHLHAPAGRRARRGRGLALAPAVAAVARPDDLRVAPRHALSGRR